MSYPGNARPQLAPLHNIVLNSYNESSFTGAQKKRKRDSIDSSRISQWFDAKIVPFEKPQTISTVSFSPVETILRAHLPLFCISTSSESEALTPGTILQADIHSITRWEYSTLVVRHVPNGGLYAIERVDAELYVCFPLRDFVTVEWIRQAAVGAVVQPDIRCLLSTKSEHVHGRSTSISSNPSFRGAREEPNSPKQPKNHRGILARQSILAKQSHNEVTVNDWVSTQREEQTVEDVIIREVIDHDADLTTLHHASFDEQNLTTVPADDATDLGADKTKAEARHLHTEVITGEDEVVQTDQLSPEYLRKRYLEMLYLSKTSLAYYAKGPLSRTRARARGNGASMTLDRLASFYRDSILPVKKLDLKYKQSLPSKILSRMDNRNGETEEIQPDAMPSRPTRKKSRRTKLGKDALWPIEEDYIEQWWSSQDVRQQSAAASETLQIEVQNRLPSLRVRETELQVVLILETLALEAHQGGNEADAVDAKQKMKAESVEGGHSGTSPNTTTTTRKKHDLRVNLEVLLDKLCILHSVGFENMVTGFAEGRSIGDTTRESSKDILKDFCKDVVIPFYSGKLPEECKAVCKKLGGLEMSPHRPKAAEDKQRTNSTPGATVSSRLRNTNKRSLDRVLSEEHSFRNVSPPVLSRSSTMPPSANTKREPSERPLSRGGVQKALSFSNREIDLVADAQATAAKKRKLDRIAAQKRELEAAIDALKKPNRSVAAKTFMDDIERRSTEQKAPSRKNEPIQILATPKISRMKPVAPDDYELPPIIAVTTSREKTIVPSSTTRPRGLGPISSMAKSSAKKRAVLLAIHDTPSRHRGPNAARADPETENDLGKDSRLPNQSSSTLVNSTPAPSRLRPDLIQTVLSTPAPVDKDDRRCLVTPVKRPQANVDEFFKDVPELRERANLMMDRAMAVNTVDAEVSIYDSLGWNDDKGL